MHASLEHLLETQFACRSMDRIQKRPNQVRRCDGLLSEMILGDEAIHHICWKLIFVKVKPFIESCRDVVQSPHMAPRAPHTTWHRCYHITWQHYRRADRRPKQTESCFHLFWGDIFLKPLLLTVPECCYRGDTRDADGSHHKLLTLIWTVPPKLTDRMILTVMWCHTRWAECHSGLKVVDSLQFTSCCFLLSASMIWNELKLLKHDWVNICCLLSC